MSAEDTFLTIKGEASSLLKEKGSKFIGYASPLQDEPEAKMTLDRIKRKYHDATHNCWAYRVGGGVGVGEKIKGLSSDDGEPSGSAGAPMLSVIAGAELTNLIVIVTRYFGGTKLGVGGLIRAYGGCVKLLIDKATIIEQTIRKDVKLLIDYPLLTAVLRVASRFRANVRQDHEAGKASLTVSVRLSEIEKFKSELIDATGGGVQFK